MKLRLLIGVALAGFAMSAHAQEQGIESEVFASEKTVIDWDDPEWWEYFAPRRQNEVEIPLGRPRYSASGPLVETFRPGIPWDERTPLQKITTLPVVSLFVPQPMPTPPAGRPDYIKWGERDVPWSNLGDHGMGGPSTWLSISR